MLHLGEPPLIRQQLRSRLAVCMAVHPVTRYVLMGCTLADHPVFDGLDGNQEVAFFLEEKKHSSIAWKSLSRHNVGAGISGLPSAVTL